MAMRKTHPIPLALGITLALLVGPMAQAQTTTPSPAAPAAEPGAVQKPAAPLKNPLNRNPARRVLPPDNSIPPPDPRDSTSRPTLPPVSSDGRDAVLPPEPPASDARRP
ncbi:hypothetical protein [Polaromonas sp. JS666]|uniref:hypothetical protein n=1 Tax=Polaromonas sp. (strain JS666 / ATCC BAA-500) TaxID=296591 RepID=UPI00088A5BC0|nr:hypothetical protein [Polaromonas sp. JS666]SDN68352.1 hypothetical protein SAMN05720382_106235 [Polaromonas sp. JS666]